MISSDSLSGSIIYYFCHFEEDNWSWQTTNFFFFAKFNNSKLFSFQVNADELPPGEYEILAMFDGNDKPVGPVGPVGPVRPVDRAENAKSISNQVQTLFVHSTFYLISL